MIPVMIGVQRAGDTVILNGATLHWVCGAGFAVNTSWNFGVRTAQQMRYAFDRDLINKTLKFRTLIPLRTLAMRVRFLPKKDTPPASSAHSSFC